MFYVLSSVKSLIFLVACLCLALVNTENHALNKNEIQEKWHFKEWKSN